MNKHTPSTGNLLVLKQSDLDQVVELHKKFAMGQRGGKRAILKFVDISDLSLRGVDLSQADFTGSNLTNVDMSNGTFTSCCFFACDLRNSNLEKANFRRADFRGAYVAGANLSGADLDSADLREGKIMQRNSDGGLDNRKRGMNLEENRSWSAIFTGAQLTETNLSGIKAIAADFSDADMTGVTLNEADLSSVSFEGANLTDADLSGSNLSNANLQDTVMSGTVLKAVELQGAQMDGMLGDHKMGESLESRGENLQELLDAHQKWVGSAGKEGAQMNLSGVDLRTIKDLRTYPLTAIKAIKANFMGLDLRKISLQSTTLDESSFRDCILHEGDMRGSSIQNAIFNRAKLSRVKLCGLKFDSPDGKGIRIQRTNLSGTKFRYADLRDGDLRDAILMGCDLTGANVTGCDLRRADLTGAILTNVDLSTARIDGAILD